MTQQMIKDNIFVIYDPSGELIVTLANGDSIDEVEAFTKLLGDFGDDYDFITFIVDNQSGLPNVGTSATKIFNDITGIGTWSGNYNDRALFGTNKILTVTRHSLDSDLSYGVSIAQLLHEIGHTWCFYLAGGVPAGNPLALLCEDWPFDPIGKYGHWGRWPDNANSCMDYDQAEWIATGNGQYNRKKHGDYEADWFGYHPLDLYLMGLIPPGEVPPISIVQNPNPPLDAVESGGTSGPYTPTPGVAQVTITDVTSYWGYRSPDYTQGQRVFHQAWIFITKDQKSDTFYDSLNSWQKNFANKFRKATGGRALIDASLLRVKKPSSQIDYQELFFRDSDTSGDIYGTDTGYFWNSPDLWVRKNDEGTSPGLEHQPPVKGQTQSSWIYACINNAGGPPYPGVTVNFYLANWANKFMPGTEFLFPVDWNPNGLIGSVTGITATPGTVVPPGKTYVRIEWPANKIPDAATCSHPCLLAEIIPLEVTPSGLHHVFENRKLAQRNITIIDNTTPDPQDPQPFMFVYDFMIGNAHRSSHVTRLHFTSVKQSEDIHLFLDPCGLMEELSDAGESMEVDLPFSSERVLSSDDGVIYINSSDFLKKLSFRNSGSHTGDLNGITISIPSETEIGILSDPDEEPGEQTLKIRFCRDTTLQIGYRKSNTIRKKYQISGLKPVILNGVPLLQVTDIRSAGLQLPLKRGQTPKLRLIGFVTSRKNRGQTVEYDITESLDEKTILGGLRLQVNL